VPVPQRSSRKAPRRRKVRPAPATATATAVSSRRRDDTYADRRKEQAAATRDSLIATAVKVFNEVGYWGTDSNALARAAGYSPGTFYRHFPDKRAIFVAAYDEWAREEHASLVARLERAREAGGDVAGAMVEFMIEHHKRWTMFRACLRVLSASDPEISKAVRAQRRRYLDLLAEVIGTRDLVDRLVVLYTLDGASESFASNEPRGVGARSGDVLSRLRDVVTR
jgi:AcrR family transcriptional regulator